MKYYCKMQFPVWFKGIELYCKSLHEKQTCLFHDIVNTSFWLLPPVFSETTCLHIYSSQWRLKLITSASLSGFKWKERSIMVDCNWTFTPKRHWISLAVNLSHVNVGEFHSIYADNWLDVPLRAISHHL